MLDTHGSGPDLSGHVVIVGAGQAGSSAAAFLRQYGWSGPITLIGEEPVPPYQRPPLSKGWLKGEVDLEAIHLRPDQYFGDHNIDLRLSSLVTAVDVAAKIVALENGEEIGFDVLVLAQGAAPRRLSIPGAEFAGVLTLRTIADADLLKRMLGKAKRMVVIGAGYVGLEAAASARALGIEVDVIEREPRILARVACDTLSSFFQDYHTARGVNFLLDAEVEGFVGEANRLTGVRVADEGVLPCDIALVGIGALPSEELALMAGCVCDRGVVVDLRARTSVDGVYAIGDCTQRPLPHYGVAGRLESVPNANEQAKQMAADLCGQPAPLPEVPWFWSDQYDIKLQIAGLPINAEQQVVRGDPASGRFSVFHLDGKKRVMAVEAVNSTGQFIAGKQFLANGKPVSVEKLRDEAVPIKEIAQ